MPLLRIVRICGFTAALIYLFHLSEQAGIARGNEEVPGLLVAIGVLSLLFLIRAFLAEFQEQATDLSRDLLWGLSAGGILTILMRVAGM